MVAAAVQYDANESCSCLRLRQLLWGLQLFSMMQTRQLLGLRQLLRQLLWGLQLFSDDADETAAAVEAAVVVAAAVQYDADETAAAVEAAVVVQLFSDDANETAVLQLRQLLWGLQLFSEMQMRQLLWWAAAQIVDVEALYDPFEQQ